MSKNLPVTIIKIIISVLFLLSGILKLLPVWQFEKQLFDLGLGDFCQVSYLSRFIISVEIAIGILILQKHYLKKIIIPFTICLLILFNIHLSMQMYQFGPMNGNCGCFGQIIPMTPLEAFIKNIITILLLIYLYLKVKEDTQCFCQIHSCCLQRHIERKCRRRRCNLQPCMVQWSNGTNYHWPCSWRLRRHRNRCQRLNSCNQYCCNAANCTCCNNLHRCTLENNRISILLITFLSVLTLILLLFPLCECCKKTGEKVEPKHSGPKDSATVPIDSTKPIPQIDTIIPKDSLKPIKQPIGPTATKSIFSQYRFDGKSADEGKKIVCMFAPGCDHCRVTAAEICKISEKLPEVYILFMDEEPEKISDFFKEVGCTYPYKIIGISEFWEKLGRGGSTPGVFYLWSGNIIKSYEGNAKNKFNGSDLLNTLSKPAK